MIGQHRETDSSKRGKGEDQMGTVGRIRLGFRVGSMCFGKVCHDQTGQAESGEDVREEDEGADYILRGLWRGSRHVDRQAALRGTVHERWGGEAL